MDTSKTRKISVSAMVCSSWGSRGNNHSGVMIGDLVVDSCTLLTSSLVLVVQDQPSHSWHFYMMNPTSFTLKLEHEKYSYDVSFAEYVFVITFAYLCF